MMHWSPTQEDSSNTADLAKYFAFRVRECVRETEILVEQQLPQGVLVCDHAGLAINILSLESVSEIAHVVEMALRPGGNPEANEWFILSTPIQMPPESGGICGRLT